MDDQDRDNNVVLYDRENIFLPNSDCDWIPYYTREDAKKMGLKGDISPHSVAREKIYNDYYTKRCDRYRAELYSRCAGIQA